MWVAKYPDIESFDLISQTADPSKNCSSQRKDPERSSRTYWHQGAPQIQARYDVWRGFQISSSKQETSISHTRIVDIHVPMYVYVIIFGLVSQLSESWLAYTFSLSIFCQWWLQKRNTISRVYLLIRFNWNDFCQKICLFHLSLPSEQISHIYPAYSAQTAQSERKKKYHSLLVVLHASVRRSLYMRSEIISHRTYTRVHRL